MVSQQLLANEALISPPSNSEHDWLQFNSNELLKGKINRLTDNQLIFNSDAVGLLNVNWNDIKQLQSAEIVTVGFADLTSLSGKLTINKGRGYLNGIPLNPEEIITIIPGGQFEANYWFGKVTLGINLHSGNTKKIDYSANIKTARRTTTSSLFISYLGNYGESEKVRSLDNHRANLQFDKLINKQVFWQPVFSEIYRNPFANMDYQATLGAGIGYQLADQHGAFGRISAGPAYSFTHFQKVQPNYDRGYSSAAFVIDTMLIKKITNNIELDSRYRLQFINPNIGGYSHHAVLTISFMVNDTIELDISSIWDRQNRPQPETDGEIPDKDDLQLSLGLGINF